MINFYVYFIYLSLLIFQQIIKIINTCARVVRSQKVIFLFVEEIFSFYEHECIIFFNKFFVFPILGTLIVERYSSSHINHVLPTGGGNLPCKPCCLFIPTLFQKIENMFSGSFVAAVF